MCILKTSHKCFRVFRVEQKKDLEHFPGGLILNAMQVRLKTRLAISIMIRQMFTVHLLCARNAFCPQVDFVKSYYHRDLR